jgi:protein-S-isoprenylcysteine O-methyltransferase Ste14
LRRTRRSGRSRLPDLGPRGEGWVAAQGVLIALEIGCAIRGMDWPDRRPTLRVAAAVGGIVAGGVLAGDAARTLGPALTPLPRPRDGGTFHESGAYRFVRHPIYGGVLLMAAGGALLTSPLATVPAALLGVLFWGKSRREEAWLVERYPEYPRYADRVRRRFVPFVW